MKATNTGRHGRRQLALLGLILVMFAGGLWQRVAIADWFRLHGYTPTAQVASLAGDDTFTSYATHMFYINRPRVIAKDEFSSHCKGTSEQTIVLGCYHSVMGGIYVLSISSDSRLQGVMQVTAAHEMLHAAYDRLSAEKRQQVDGWLEDYYRSGLTDQRVKQTVDLYKKSEPDSVVNEMHSIFGTEIANLPENLESYYKQYFTDRQKIAGYAATYQAEFTGRQELVKQYDAQLATLQSQITRQKLEVTSRQTSLNTKANQMAQLKANGQIAAYNEEVDNYNAAVNDYNALVALIRSEIERYNSLVATRNSVALEQNRLVQELSGNNLQAATKQ
jgi:hypothetical protein